MGIWRIFVFSTIFSLFLSNFVQNCLILTKLYYFNQLLCVSLTKLGFSHVNSWLKQQEQREQWDGATNHAMAEVIRFLNTKFWGCIISCKAKVKWPPYSPNLNPLNYFFCNYAMINLRRRKPATIDELKKNVTDIASRVPEQMKRWAISAKDAISAYKLKATTSSLF